MKIIQKIIVIIALLVPVLFYMNLYKISASEVHKDFATLMNHEGLNIVKEDVVGKEKAFFLGTVL